jgi:hypothetical protein
MLDMTAAIPKWNMRRQEIINKNNTEGGIVI